MLRLPHERDGLKPFGASARSCDTDGVEVACTLSAADLRDRRGVWAALCQRALTVQRTTPHGVELAFRPDPGVEPTLRELARLEADCCSFAEWAVETRDGHVLLDVSAREASAVPAVRALFG